ncbi:MAG: DegT/DnrJ/EryC1/StrS aminotransferase family protein [Flavobacteriales bacterium]|nr:DegT/DnrJ/EryC1/StrS aminotransferase family protein [Flavobacteriales bacterium]
MKQIPFSPPRIDQKTVDAVTEVLLSGWITTGPKTRELESRINTYCGSGATLCLNSWTNAAELVLRWLGVGPGDEVIVPAYTYAATANIVVHVGATPILVDVAENSFAIDITAIRSKITAKTKVIMPVDIGGMPCDYDAVMKLVEEPEIKAMFQPASDHQKTLGRILVMADAAHSFGAIFHGKKVGSQTDVMGFSFHAVKNLTTAEGGALTLNLPAPFDNAAVRASLNVSALHGQSKDALTKTQAGQWRYDIVEAGYKCNLTDIHAVIGLVEMDRYDSETLPRRKEICQLYTQQFKGKSWFMAPIFTDGNSESCYHLYALRILGLNETGRDEVIRMCAEKGIALNVHFQPLPLLSFYKNKGYRMDEYPNAWAQYVNEISLPVYYNLSDEDVKFVSDCIINAVESLTSA